ncbi:MAG: hypothetical protein E2O39_08270, partial [Planctomycetota bacterium]
MITARSRRERSGTVPLAHVPILLAPLLALVAAGCGGDSDGVSAASIEDTLARERAAAYFNEGSLARARQAIAPLVPPARRTAALEDLARAAVIE